MVLTVDADPKDSAPLVAALESKASVRRTPSGDGAMIWHEFGAGTPLILLHGGHGSWTHWFKNIPPFAEKFHVLAADLPGFGDSALPPEPHSMEGLAEVVAAGIKQLIGDQPCYLMGFSFGSMISCLVARILGKQIRRVVLVSISALGVPRASFEDMQRWRELTDEAQIISAHRRNLAILMFADEAKIDPLAVFLQFDNARRARLKGRKLVAATDVRASVPHITAPMTVIWGEKDVGVGGAFDVRIDVLNELKPGVRTYIIPDAGHWVQYEMADEFNKIALAELTEERTS